jgi:uncharacterized protein (DUF427 family)
MTNTKQPPPVSPRLQRARAVWRYVGDRRPPFALEPGPGEESVWDYPRPPAIDLEPEPIIVRAAGTVVAETGRALRVLETASPPTVYLPRGDVDESLLRSCPGSSTCEWKGAARYGLWRSVAGDSRRSAGPTRNRCRNSRSSPAISRSIPGTWTARLGASA